VIAAVTGAVLLDLDKPMLHFFGRNPFPAPIRTIHGWVQNESPEGMPNELGFGLGLAAVEFLRVRRERGETNPPPRFQTPRIGQTAPLR
jgi:hypothetical protein